MDGLKAISEQNLTQKDPDIKLTETAQHAVLNTIEDDDERLLARIGYKQEFRREFTRWSTVSYAISILGVLGSMPATFGIPIASGGPATAVWAWFIGSVRRVAFEDYVQRILLKPAVAELVSAYPTAGGMYFVTKHVVPERHVAIWSWVIGWSNLLGQLAGVASLAYTVSQMVLAAAAMNSGFDADGLTYRYSPTAAQTVLLALCVLIILWFAPINVLASISICIALLILTPDKRSAKSVFTEVTNGSGWGSRGFSFLLGFLSVAWTMTDYDGTTHLSEECKKAAIFGPLAIRLAIVVTGVIGEILTITFCFCLTDIDSILNTPTGLPAAQIFLNAGGRGGGTVMLSFTIAVQVFTGCSAMLANARMVFAFARDNALPFSRIRASISGIDPFPRFWSKISPKTSTPIHAVWLVVLLASILNLIGIGSSETIIAIFNVCAPALDISYVAVILAHLIYAHRVEFIPGPFSLGKGGKYINAVLSNTLRRRDMDITIFGLLWLAMLMKVAVVTSGYTYWIDEECRSRSGTHVEDAFRDMQTWTRSAIRRLEDSGDRIQQKYFELLFSNATESRHANDIGKVKEVLNALSTMQPVPGNDRTKANYRYYCDDDETELDARPNPRWKIRKDPPPGLRPKSYVPQRDRLPRWDPRRSPDQLYQEFEDNDNGFLMAHGGCAWRPESRTWAVTYWTKKRLWLQQLGQPLTRTTITVGMLVLKRLNVH
ncbi:MAG: hypothetical protein Q9227_004697 [Pyrenula ochraceoflavens]